MKPAPPPRDFAPSLFAARCVAELKACPTMIALDVACGHGRHSLLLAAMGFDVIAIDRDESALHGIRNRHSGLDRLPGQIHPVAADLSFGIPMQEKCVGVIIAVDFPMIDLVPVFQRLLMPGGYVIVETFGLHGGNWMQLPKAGQLKKQLQFGFDVLNYRERQCARPQIDAVSVQAFARRTTI